MTFNYLTPKAETRISPIDEKGTFAIKKIKANELIAIFGGQVMSVARWRALPSAVKGVCLQINEKFLLGPLTPKNCGDGDYVNHSCEPNAGFRGQIYLVALRDIRPGEEIAFDYAMTVSEPTQLKFKCGCGSKTCRGTFSASDWRKKDLRKKYQGYFSHYLAQKIKAND